MSIENLVPSVTTSPMLVSDTVGIAGGSQDSVQPSLTKINGETVSAAFEVQSTDGGVLVPRLSQATIDGMTVANGMFYYNTDDETFDFNANGVVIPLGESTGDVLGPDESEDGNIAIFDGVTGKIIADSGVNISQVPAPAPLGSPAPLVGDVIQIGNIGNLQFVDGVGSVFVDSLVGAQFIENDFGPESQICTLITGDLPGATTTPSALLELQSTTGAILISRMTTSEIDDLTASNGMMVYDTDLQKFKMFEGGEWKIVVVTISSGDEAPPPTYNNQLVTISQGYNGGGFGSSMVGLNKTLNIRTVEVFNTAAVNANSKGFSGSAFDGRYIYFSPLTTDGGITYDGQVTRFDTRGSFTDSDSYSFFDTTTVNANSKGFKGAAYDGQYIYFVPNYTGSAFSGQITRYDTRKNFNSAASYDVFDTTTVDANSKGFFGAVFDGRYIYFVPLQTSLADGYSGQITRYDTQSPFADAGSYAVFNTTAVNANSKGFMGGISDGQYIYFVPALHADGPFGQITRYDTTKVFTDAASYEFFDTTTVDAGSEGFIGAVFDGRYVYLVPNHNGIPAGQITRYDTTMAFDNSGAPGSPSYEVFDATTVNVNSKRFFGGVYDGRYIYFIPFDAASGQITRYDVTKSFTSTSSYSVLDTAVVNANSKGFSGGIYDGKYVYMNPYNNGSASGQITRIDAYSGPPVPVLTHGA